ncbi:coil containing protein [Vibrio phage 1.101.O._10N.261.45.C6]|nr:coil containing protein [Vibrio phage 1.101.O._10N.261.45.C6]
MSEIRYSKKSATKIITDGEDRRDYSIRLMGAEHVALVGVHLLKVVSPALGTGGDYMNEAKKNEEYFGDMVHTWGATIQHLSDNIHDEFAAELFRKTLGSLCVNGNPVKWEEHFDDYPQDMLEILIWSAEENIRPFLLRSTMLQRFWKSGKIQKFKKQLDELLNTEKK